LDVTQQLWSGIENYAMGGFLRTLWLFALTLLFSLPLGLVVSFGSMSRFFPLRVFTKIIVWIIRGTPLMLQVIVLFFVPGLLYVSLGTTIAGMRELGQSTAFLESVRSVAGSLRFNREMAALVAFIINYACYFSEIFRGGIQSISRSQYEAGQVLGMTKSQIFFRVVLLQVTKRIMAPMANEIITLVKDTALAQVIGVIELFHVARTASAREFSTTPIFVAGLFYLFMNWVVTIVFVQSEKKLNYYS
jgi:polar amino acid transport system permease protein